jgi:hypothetical protein
MNDEVTPHVLNTSNADLAGGVSERSRWAQDHALRFAIIGADERARKLALSLLDENTQISIITQDDQEARTVLNDLSEALSRRASPSNNDVTRNALQQIQVTPELQRIGRHNLIFVFQDESDVNGLTEKLILLEAAASRETPVAVCLSIEDDPTLTMATAPNPNRVVPVFNLLPEFEATVLFPVDTQLCRASCLEKVIHGFSVTGHTVFPLSIENSRSQLQQVVSSWVMEGLRWFDEGLADIRTIDRLFRSATVHHLGPLQLADFIGLDFVLSAVEARGEDTSDEGNLPIVQLSKRVAAGNLGWKSGSGFYNYDTNPIGG